jgi:hypothetical protein
MFGYIKRKFGVVTAEEKNGTVYVEGVNANFMDKDFQKMWKTSKIGIHMFSKITRNGFQLPSFFALELRYMLEKLLGTGKQMQVSRRTARQIVDQLNENTWLASTMDESKRCLNLDNLKKFHWKPLDHQLNFLLHYDKLVPQFGLHGMILAAAAGSGKAQPLDSFIKTPGGWAQMKDMKVGTPIIAKDGSTSKVIGVFPQGIKEVFRITFSDGRTAEACGDHLWKIKRRKRGDHQFREIVTTDKISEYLQGHLEKRVFIDLPDPEIGEDVSLPIDPYLLGALLGDGSMAHSSVTFTTPDEFLVKEVEGLLPNGMEMTKRRLHGDKCPTYSFIYPQVRLENPLRDKLDRLGLMGKHSWDKFIPEEYLYASSAQRLALLQGLMDTDGTICPHGAPSYCTTSLDLAENVQYLVRSLGGIASISIRNPHFTYKGEKRVGRRAYQVNIRFKKPSDLFRLPKKKDRARDNGQYCEHLSLRIESIESIGLKETQCIAIDHPEHLYITNNFVVTHNTALTLFLSECLESDYTIVVSPKLALDKVWRQTLGTIFKTPTTFWVSNDNAEYNGQKYLVVHYEYLEKLMEFVGKLSGKITIILDESHNLNEISSLRARYFIDLCKKTKSENVIWASGTSFKAQGTESIPIFTTIEPRFTPAVAESFKKLYGTGGGRALDILAHRVDIMSFKVEKSELKLEPPRIVDVPVKVPNGDDFTLDKVKQEMQAFVEERSKYYASRKSLDQDFFDSCLLKAYKTFKRPIEFEEYERYLRYIKVVQQNVGDLSVCKDELMFCNRYERDVIMPKLDNAEAKQFKDVKSIIKYVSLKIQGECLGRILGKRRMECIKAVSQHIDYSKIIESTEKKTVIFTSYVEVLESTSHKVADLGYSPMVVYGKTNTELASIVTAFETKKEINPLIATYQSLSTAVPLTVADCMIMVNAPFRDYIHQQAISRIHRIGANTQVTVYIAKLDTGVAPNLSSRSLDILAWSQSQVEMITRTKSPFPVSETTGVSLESQDNQGNYNEHDFIGITYEALDINEAFEDIDEVGGLEPVTIDTVSVPKLDMHRTLFNWN